MKRMSIVIIIVVVIIALLTGIYGYYGGFQPIHIEVKEDGGEVLVYESYVGEYKNSHKVSDSIYYSLLNNEKIETYKGFGIYYDDPQKVEKSKLRSDVGCILESADSTLIAELSKKYKLKTYPKTEYITAEFATKGMPSMLIAIFRVYPKLREYSKQNGYDENTLVMEIYDVPNKKTIFRREAIKVVNSYK